MDKYSGYVIVTYVVTFVILIGYLVWVWLAAAAGRPRVVTTPALQLPQARRRRKNPLPYLLAGAVLAGLLAYIIFGNLAQSIEYFVTPTEYQAEKASLQGRTVRIGGLVKAVSYDRATPRSAFQRH